MEFEKNAEIARIRIQFATLSPSRGLYKNQQSKVLLDNLIENYFASRGLQIRHKPEMLMGLGAAATAIVSFLLRFTSKIGILLVRHLQKEKQKQFAKKNFQIFVWLDMEKCFDYAWSQEKFEFTQVIDLSMGLGQQIQNFFSNQHSIRFRISLGESGIGLTSVTYNFADLRDVPAYKIQKVVSKIKASEIYEIKGPFCLRLKKSSGF